MEGAPRAERRDINELLTTGYFKTKRGKSPSGFSASPRESASHLRTYQYDTEIPRGRERDERSRSRTPAPKSKRSTPPPPPRPIVEDEAVSLARESGVEIPSYDPPLRGIVEQNPIILEAEVTKAEAQVLQDISPRRGRDGDSDSEGNRERRFVLIPKNGDTEAVESGDEGEDRLRKERMRRKSSRRDEDRPKRNTLREEERPGPEGPRAEERREPARPQVQKKRSRQDLPSLETKIPREIPPQFRRSASAYTGTPKDYAPRENGTPRENTGRELETPRSSKPRTPSGEYFLSPDVLRQKDYFNALPTAPRTQYDNLTARTGTPGSAQERHHSASGSRPGTATSEKRQSGGWIVEPRSRRTSSEKLTRPQQLAEETRRPVRPPSPHSARPSSRRSSRDSTHSSRHRRSSSEEDGASDSERRRRRHRDYDHRNPEEFDRHGRSLSRSNRSSVDAKKSSRYSTPLPSPGISPSQISAGDELGRADTYPSTRRRSSRPVSPLSAGGRMTPIEPVRPQSRQSMKAFPKTSTPVQTAPYPESLPIPIPARIDLHSPGDTRRSPEVPQFEDFRSASARPPPPPPSHWQPPPFQPSSSNNLEKPMGSYRRFSEDVDSGSIAPLASCPRTSFTRGRNDWLTLPECPNFDICPSCFNSTIANTEFRHLFIPSPRRPPEAEVLCDFGSSPWYRIAWLLTIKERRRDLSLFYGLANVADTIQPCIGNHEAVRQWHSIIDPKSGNPIRGFDVCLSCVKSIETLLPILRGIFVRTDLHGPLSPRICDMRFDSKRFIQYFDVLETTSDTCLLSPSQSKPDIRPLATLAKRLTLFPECQRDTELLNHRWHIISQLPEFTVCQECFDEVVWPEMKSRNAIPLMFKEGLVRIPRASCGLYSERMRAVFREAVRKGDFIGLARRVRERKAVEERWRGDVEELRRGVGIGKRFLGVGEREREMERLRGEWARWE